MRPRVVEVIALEDYKLKLKFDNGELKIFNVNPYFKFKAFEKLKDFKESKLVKVDGLSIKWECGVDICPDELYNLSVNL